MSSVVDAILGRGQGLTEDDVPPVMAARQPKPVAARRLPPKDEEEKELQNKAAKVRSSSVVAGILGMTENEEEGIIPQDAKPFDTFSTQQIPGMQEPPKLDNAKPSEPSVTNIHGEELIPPTAALVAPDVTPNVLQLVDPSQVPAPPVSAPPPGPAPAVGSAPPQPTSAPGAEGALDTILGRQNPAPQPAPVSVESFQQTITDPVVRKQKIAEALVPAKDGGRDMPKHVEGDGKAILNAFRQFNG